MSDQDDATEDEVIIGTSVSPNARRVRVYDSRGDFLIDIPAGATMTFGYFNPVAAGSNEPRDNWGEGRTRNTFKTTALRIYEKGAKSPQIACFLGVSGFRDERIKLTRLKTKVVIETNMSDDGEGGVEWGGAQMKQLIAAPEPDTYS